MFNRFFVSCIISSVVCSTLCQAQVPAKILYKSADPQEEFRLGSDLNETRLISRASDNKGDTLLVHSILDSQPIVRIFKKDKNNNYKSRLLNLSTDNYLMDLTLRLSGNGKYAALKSLDGSKDALNLIDLETNAVKLVKVTDNLNNLGLYTYRLEDFQFGSDNLSLFVVFTLDNTTSVSPLVISRSRLIRKINLQSGIIETISDSQINTELGYREESFDYETGEGINITRNISLGAISQNQRYMLASLEQIKGEYHLDTKSLIRTNKSMTIIYSLIKINLVSGATEVITSAQAEDDSRPSFNGLWISQDGNQSLYAKIDSMQQISAQKGLIRWSSHSGSKAITCRGNMKNFGQDLNSNVISVSNDGKLAVFETSDPKHPFASVTDVAAINIPVRECVRIGKTSKQQYNSLPVISGDSKVVFFNQHNEMKNEYERYELQNVAKISMSDLFKKGLK